LTLIRSSYEPDILPEIGEHEVHVALQPFTAEMAVAEAMHIGQEFNHAIRVIGTDMHPGRLPVIGKFATIEPQSIILSAIKKAEDGDGLVLRLINPTSEDVTVRLSLDAGLMGTPTSAQEVDLMERPLPNSTVKIVGDTLSVLVGARGIASVLMGLAPAM